MLIHHPKICTTENFLAQLCSTSLSWAVRIFDGCSYENLHQRILPATWYLRYLHVALCRLACKKVVQSLWKESTQWDTIGDSDGVSGGWHFTVNPAIQFPEPGKGRDSEPHDESLVAEAIWDVWNPCRPVRGLGYLTRIRKISRWVKSIISVRFPGNVGAVNVVSCGCISIFNTVNSVYKQKSS